MKTRLLALALAAAFLAPAQAEVPVPKDQAYPGTLRLEVDATNVGQQIFQMRMTLPVKPGPLTLLYPQWLPANHGPNNALNLLAGLVIRANGKPLEWKRDPVHVHAFHLNVPAGVSQIEAVYQFLSPLEPGQGRITMTPEMLGIQWPAVTLYPAGYVARRVPVQASVRLPAGWQFGTALETEASEGDLVRFKPTDLETLIDSPMFAGRYFKRIALSPADAKAPVHLNLVADTAEALDAKPEQIALHQALVTQAAKLFQSVHYRHYDFLLALSDEFGGIGREHHESSENGVKPDYFSDWAKTEAGRALLPHEYTHSWNGKFRRPAGQKVPNFNTPLDNELLWVYEGQTQFWGNVLAARSGLMSASAVRDTIAATAARLDSVQGRQWRALQDTVNDPIINARRAQPWNNWQRAEDYYQEGMLIWLDVDSKLRELSQDQRSIDDFARAFFGIRDGDMLPAYYRFEDVVATLNQIAAYDWAPFLRARLDGHGPGAPLDGLARLGWKLVYSETPTPFLKQSEERAKSASFTYSLGFSVSASGNIEGLVWDGVGYRAGLAANTSLVAVNNRAYKPELLKAAITAAKDGKTPISLLVKKGNVYRTITLDYHGGLRYPRLERIEGSPDRLSALLSPR
ncbi:M61 family metallopeptidase [Massilia sp. TS11]|uniref:M61 family metallopeptidase n=1 Tax=Massilia sp. TS11 TaxID=2908003 RepID=UPI001EDBE903|nr:peptidase M61 [Massilia sp. TS11]MCG2582937.1 peptidase M61 [Massilia sp. TS11]